MIYRDPGASVPIFGYQALHSLPHLQHQHPPHGLLQTPGVAGVGGGGAGRGGVRGGGGAAGVCVEGGEGMMFEGLYQEPSLGHLVGVVRYYVHRMEVVSKEEVRVLRPLFIGDGGGARFAFGGSHVCACVLLSCRVWCAQMALRLSTVVLGSTLSEDAWDAEYSRYIPITALVVYTWRNPCYLEVVDRE